MMRAMRPPEIDYARAPKAGEDVEVWDYIEKRFVVRAIKSVLHLGMKGWTVECSLGLLMDVVPTGNDGRTKPAWREYRP